MFDMREMSEEDKLFNFIVGLQPWAQVELHKQGIKDLSLAVVAADRLVDFRVINDQDQEHRKEDSGNKQGEIL